MIVVYRVYSASISLEAEGGESEAECERLEETRNIDEAIV